MKLSRYTLETRAFVLNWTSLERLYGAIAARLPKTTIIVKCVDRLDRHLTSLDELRAFDNPARAAILELQITGRNVEQDQRFSLSLSCDRRSNVQVSLDANEDDGDALNLLVNDAVESLRPWYSWIARADWYLLVLGGWLATQLLLLAFKLALAGDKPITFSVNTPGTGQDLLRSVLIGAAPLAVGILLNLVRNKYFPVGVFAIGQGELRHTSNEVTRTVLIAGLAVSILTSLAFSWFS